MSMDRQKVLQSHFLMNFCSLSCLCQQRYPRITCLMEVMMSFCPSFSWVIVNVQQTWIGLAVKYIEVSQKSIGIAFSFLQVSFNFQTSSFQNWIIVICWSEYLILYLVLVRTEEGDGSITNSAVAGFQVPGWKWAAKYWVALVTVVSCVQELLQHVAWEIKTPHRWYFL